MERMTTRDFQKSFHRLTEPVEVMSGIRTIGFFYPGVTAPIVTPVEHRTQIGGAGVVLKPLPAQERFGAPRPAPKGKK